MEGGQDSRAQIEQPIQQIRSLSKQGAARDGYDSELNAYAKQLRLNRLIHSQSRIGRVISEIAQSDPSQALRLALCVRNAPLSWDHSKWSAKWARAKGKSGQKLRHAFFKGVREDLMTAPPKARARSDTNR